MSPRQPDIRSAPMALGRSFRIALAALSVWLWAAPAAAQPVNDWTNRFGYIQGSRGWIDWQRNDVDGRYCLHSGHSAVNAENDVWCYDANLNRWEEVHPGNLSATPPKGGDLHAWGWDHVGREYLLFDGSKVGRRAYAFSLATRTWRPIDNDDFTGLDGRTFISSSGVATSPDHDLMVLTHGGAYPSRVTRFLNLRTRAYGEINSSANPPVRTYVQNQFLYISSIRKFLLFGGWTGTQYLNDLWLLDPLTKSWMPIAHVNAPPGVANGQMAYDPAQNVVYLVGGDAGSARVSVLDIGSWTWQHLPLPPGSVMVDYPPRRRHGTAMFHETAGFCTVAGGLDGAASLGLQWWHALQTWCFRHTVVTDTISPGPPAGGDSGFSPSNRGDLLVLWNRSLSDPADVTRYEVQRSEDNGATWIDLVTVPANGSATYTHKYVGVPDGRVRVRALDAAGNPSTYVNF